MQAIDARLYQLRRVLGIAVVVYTAREREARGALIVRGIPREGVARGQRVVLRYLAIQPQIILGISARRQDPLRNLYHLKVGVQRAGIDE